MSNEQAYDWQHPDYREFDIGAVISRGFTGLSRQSGKLLPLALVLSGGPGLIVYTSKYLLEKSGALPTLLVFVGIVLFFVGSVLLSAILIQVFVRHFWNDHIEVDVAMKIALGRFWPIVGGSLLMGFGLAFGMLLLVFPALILYAGWYVFLPVVIGERRDPVDALTRSWGLTRGHKWSVFGVAICTVMISMVIGGIIGGIGGAIVGAEAALMLPEANLGKVFAFGLIRSFAGIIGTFMSAAMVASTYVELMRVNGEHDPDSLAPVY
jgi:hypothetical protein